MTPIKPVSNPHVCRILAAAWAALPTDKTYAMLAGGCIRDLVHGVEPKDYDLTVWGVGPDGVGSIIQSLGRVGFSTVQCHCADYEDIRQRVVYVQEMRDAQGVDLDVIVYSGQYESAEECMHAFDFNINAFGQWLRMAPDGSFDYEAYYAYSPEERGVLVQTRDVEPARGAKVVAKARELGWLVPPALAAKFT